MGFPDNYTQPTPDQPFSDRQRNTMLGNAWHLPTAIWILFLLVIPATAHIPQSPSTSALDQMTQAWLNSPLPFGPPPKTRTNENMPQLDWQSHLRWARTQAASFYNPRPIDPTLMWAIQIQQKPHMPSIRHSVVQEIQQLIEQDHEQTTQRHSLLPTHCQIAYQQPKMITQIPTLISLLQRIHYPHTHTHILQRELSSGFPLLGQLQPGLQWHIRSDNKYTEPQSIEDLRTFNKDYILKKLQHPHVDDNWELMADEIAAEVRTGRMKGPFSPPKWFTTQTVPLQTNKHHLPKLPLPHDNPIIAMAFSIKQTGSDGNPKIRRGEDWRRSGHNRACQMNDQPYHHTPDHSEHSKTFRTTATGMGTRPRWSIQTTTIGRPWNSIRPIIITNTTRTHTVASSRPLVRFSRQRMGLQQVWRRTDSHLTMPLWHSRGSLRRRLRKHQHRTRCTKQLPHFRPAELHPGVPHETLQRTETCRRTRNTRRHHPMPSRSNIGETVPPQNTTTPTRTTQPPSHRQHVTRRSPQTRGEPKASSIEKIQSRLNFSIEDWLCLKINRFFNWSKVSKFNRKINRNLFKNQSKFQ